VKFGQFCLLILGSRGEVLKGEACYSIVLIELDLVKLKRELLIKKELSIHGSLT